MEWLNPYAIVFLGAGLGGVLRHVLNNAIPKIAGTAYPWATPVINVTGSIVMGLLVGFLAFRAGQNQNHTDFRLLAGDLFRGI